VTQRGVNRQSVFFSVGDRLHYLRLLAENLDEAQVRVLAFCLMTNHIHFIVVPERDDSLAVLFRRVHGRFAQYLNVRRHRTGHLWQNRFFSCPVSAEWLWKAIRYVEENPVRALLVDAPEQYEWSSAPAHLGVAPERVPLLDMDFWKNAGGDEAWRRLHGKPTPVEEVRLLRRCTYAGRPFGEEEFVQQFEELFHRQWRRWGFEVAATSGGT
jgi:putative transposase